MTFYRKITNRPCGHIPRLLMVACSYSMTASGGYARDISVSGSKGLPFLLGTSDYETGKTERAEILASHLAIYKTMLGNEAIVGRVKALGWSDKLKPQPRRSAAEEIARIDSRISRIKKDLMEAYPAIKRKVATLVKYYKKISPDYDFSHYDTLLRGETAPSSQADTHQ